MINCEYPSCKRRQNDLEALTMYTLYRGKFYHNQCADNKREQDIKADGWEKGICTARHKDGRELTVFELLNQCILEEDLKADGWEIGKVVDEEWIVMHRGRDKVERGDEIARHRDGHELPIYELFQQRGTYYMQWVMGYGNG